MESKQKAVCGGMQGAAKNSNADALPGSPQSLKFSYRDSNENFIRPDLSQLEPG
jgi:hypothetical protein